MRGQLIEIPVFSARIGKIIAETREKLGAQGKMSLAFINATDTDPAEVSIYGIIGDPFEGANSASFGRFLRDNKKKAVNVRINSPGGLAYDGITIHNALMQHDGQVTTQIDGQAGSAASIIAVAGYPARMFENGTFFIHRAQVDAMGNASIMQEALDWLTQLDEQIAKTYKGKTGRAMDKIMAQMVGDGGDGTPFNAKDALANKFVDEIMPLKRNAERPKAAAQSTWTPAMIAEAKRVDARREVLAQK